MKNLNTILVSVQAFMDNMQDGDMRELGANLQAALEKGMRTRLGMLTENLGRFGMGVCE